SSQRQRCLISGIVYLGAADVDPISKKIDDEFSKYPKRSYPKGQILIFADESPEHIFYITKGRVRKYDVSYRGDEVIVNIFKPPAFFPMSEAINHTPNKFFYKTELATELHIVPGDAALQFLKDNPDVMLDLLSRIYRGMEGLLGRMVELMSGSAKSRLLYELMIESRRFGKKNDEGSYDLDISEVDLAARAGMSRETVSREMKQIKADGLVSISSKGIVVTDLAALSKKAGVED
ncbi:MAG TPA: Crp/Fnr family transcriptional regulator, partial [Candidatus Saccharimonadales bacterium]|nr:Crp/Fnr family transcriptional regulator [Candidatus Saccharimonadales bacterium]